TNSIVDYQWQLIPIDDKLAKPDKDIQKFIDSFKGEVDRKYQTLVCKFAQTLTHPQREIETSLGNLVADAFAQTAECDVMLVGSGSIRIKKMGPLVILKDLLTCFPYDDTLNRYQIKGKHLKKVFKHIMRSENRDGEGECYQVNQGVEAVYSDKRHQLISLKINGQPVSDQKRYTLCLQGYHFKSAPAYLNITHEELLSSGQEKVVTTSAQQVLEEYLRHHQNLKRKVEGRLVFQD
ncbi:MAG TPA: 5'-nucleotidase, partial [Candidatus Bathyarchaeia archaeon]|nr:5'-nucleotidase [Candidatus Bathyarchaeia archaeon]